MVALNSYRWSAARRFSAAPGSGSDVELDVPAIEKCYYKTLGVEKDANSHQIKQAYFEIAKQWHPDKVSGDSEAVAYFTHVSKAYETLFDDHKRAIYDEDSIDDDEYFTIKIGPLSVNLFVVFLSSLGLSVGAYGLKWAGYLGGKSAASSGCPIDLTERQEMAKLANDQRDKSK